MPTQEIEPRKTLPAVEDLRRLFAYDPETGALTTGIATKIRPVGSVAGHITPTGYRRVIIGDNDRYLAHRIVWKLMTGQEPPEFVDHVDGNRLNNAWANLRGADQVTNAQNVARHRRNKLGVKGVSVCGKTGKFIAFIRAGGKNRYLGAFEDISAAEATYRAAAERTFGEFARVERAA